MPPCEARVHGHAEVARTYRIRPATMADSPAIRRIRNAAVRESLAIWTSIEQDHAEAEAWLAPMVQRGTALEREEFEAIVPLIAKSALEIRIQGRLKTQL